MTDQIAFRSNEDGTVVVLSAPERAVVSAQVLDEPPFIRVTPHVVYVDTVNPKLYWIVGVEDGLAELKRSRV